MEFSQDNNETFELNVQKNTAVQFLLCCKCRLQQGNDIYDFTLNGITVTAQIEAFLKMQQNKYASFFDTTIT